MKLTTDPRLPMVTDTLQYLQNLNARLYELFRDVARANNALSDGFLFSTSTVTGNYTATTSDQLLLVSTTATVTLPAAVETNGKRFVVKNIGDGVVTVVSTSGMLDGNVSIVVGVKYTSLDFVSDGTNYWII